MGKQIFARETVNKALPPLLKTDSHTTASALHPLIYNGELNHWPNFCQDVRATIDNEQWSKRVIGYALNSRDLDDNKVFVGDETGVQGRFQQAIGQTLGKVFEAQRLDIQFADFKCLPSLGNNDMVPDCVMKTSRNELKVVGELKVPWVPRHGITRYLRFEPFIQDSRFRVSVGQVLRYMKELGCMYGFLSNYEEAIFLRQRHNGTTWVVDCSPVILASNVHTKESPTVTVRECFFYIAILARPQAIVDNRLPPSEWVSSTR